MKKKSSPVKSPRGPSNNLSPPSSKELSAQFKSEESDKSRDIFKLTGLSGFPALAMGLGFLFLLAIVLKGLRIIFLPMILAFFISCILNPLVVFFTGRGFPRSLSVLLTLSLGLCAMWLAFNYAVGNLTDFAEGFPRYKGRLDELVGRAARFINGRFNFITLDLVKSKLSEISYGAILSSFLNSVFTFTGYLALTIIFLLYFLPSLPSLPNKLQLAFPGQRGKMICLAVAQAGEQIQRYILAKTLLSCGLALALTSICYAFKVDFAASWGIFAFLLCFIPNLGPPLAVAPPFLVCLVQYGTSRALWLLAVLSLLEAVYGNWIEPLILGRSVHLSPTVTLLSFLFWGWLWGGVGMVLAVPLMAAVKCSCDNFKSLKPIGTLMGN